MAESTGGECGAGMAAMRGRPTATAAPGSRGRRGPCSPPRAARRWRGGGAGRTRGVSPAHPGDPGSPPAAGQGPPLPPCPRSAARERSRVRALQRAFLALQAALPAVPPGTKLSKLDVLVLATSYIAHLSHALGRGPPPPSRPPRGHPLLHPMKKWPMRSRLFAGPWGGPAPDPPGAAAATSSRQHAGLGGTRLAVGDGPPLSGVPTATGAPTPAPPRPSTVRRRRDLRPHPAGGPGSSVGQHRGDTRGGGGRAPHCPRGLGAACPDPQQ